jgi:hypothetical protein
VNLHFGKAALASAAVFGLAFGACGGGGGGGFDVENADAVAHDVLPGTSDLPGDGWTATATDDFSESEPFDSKACNALEEKRLASKKVSDPSRKGRAQVEFQREGETFPTEVEVEVNIFEKASVPEKQVKDQKAAFEEFLTDCFRDTLSADLDPEKVKLVVEDAGLNGKLPGNGVAKAINVSLTEDGQKYELRLETYNWQYKNAGITVSFNGDREEITSQLVEDVLEKVQANLEAAAK